MRARSSLAPLLALALTMCTPTSEWTGAARCDVPPPASQAAVATSCAPECYGGPGSCGCSEDCPGDHSRMMNCDATTCVCMLDDSEVDAFDVSASCERPESVLDAFVHRCGATRRASTPAPDTSVGGPTSS